MTTVSLAVAGAVRRAAASIRLAERAIVRDDGRLGLVSKRCDCALGEERAESEEV